MADIMRWLVRHCSPDLRLRWVLIAWLAISLALLTLSGARRPWLVWNVSASAPTGLYAVGAATGLARGDMVIAKLPEPWRLFAAQRFYLPRNVPLVKRIAAVPGDRVCASGERLLVGRHVAAWRLAIDARGRSMPRWSGCRTLDAEEYLLLMTGSPGSFDGRYFGISRANDLIGRATLLWAR